MSSFALKPLFLRLGSMSLAVVLLMVLAIASVIGTVLLQNQEQADYLRQFGPVWYWTFRSLGLFDMYHTWWFLALLGFLMLSLTVCLWRNTPRMLKEMRSRKVTIAEKSLKRFHHLHHWHIRGALEPAELGEQLKGLFSGWELKSAQDAGRSYLRADKGRFHKWGYILVHAAILVILIGGWISVQFGFRGDMAVPEGQSEKSISFLKGTSVEHMQMPFEVRCNSFDIEFFPTGAPKEFRSNLTIIDGGKEVLTSDIIVNEPLYYKGVRIYQASFGDGGSDVTLKLFHLDGSRKITTIHTKVYETWRDPETGISLQITDFKPYNVQNIAGEGKAKKFRDLGPAVDFVIRGPGLKPVKIRSFMRPFTANGENQGTMMMVSMTGEERDFEPFLLGLDFTSASDWELFHAFSKRISKQNARDEKANFAAFKAAMREVFGENRPPDFQMIGMRTLQAMTMIPQLPWPFVPVLDDYEKVYYTGLQLTRDPGMNVVWVGSAILVIGLCIMFYMPHRKLWLVIEPEGKALCVHLAGMTNRNRLNFEQEFHQLLSKMDAHLRAEKLL